MLGAGTGTGTGSGGKTQASSGISDQSNVEPPVPWSLNFGRDSIYTGPDTNSLVPIEDDHYNKVVARENLVVGAPGAAKHIIDNRYETNLQPSIAERRFIDNEPKINNLSMVI